MNALKNAIVKYLVHASIRRYIWQAAEKNDQETLRRLMIVDSAFMYQHRMIKQAISNYDA